MTGWLGRLGAGNVGQREAPVLTDFDHTLAPHEIRRIAADAFVFGFPLVLVDLVRRAHPVGANQILHLPDDAADVAPGLRDGDPRMVQSSAWIDLRWTDGDQYSAGRGTPPHLDPD